MLRCVATLERSKRTDDEDLKAIRDLLDWVIYPDWDEGEPDLRGLAWSDGLPPDARQAMVVVTLAGANFVKSSKRSDKAALLGACERVMEICGVRRKETPAAGQLLDKQTEARDKFVYDKVCKGTAPEQIQDSIEQHPKWESLADEADVRTCAIEYARRHGLDPPAA